MKPVLIHLRPLDRSTGQRVDVYAGDSGDAGDLGAAGLVWEPAVRTRPTLTTELFNQEMDGKVQTGSARFELSLRSILRVANPMALSWRGAAVKIWSASFPDTIDGLPDFDGLVTAAAVDLDNGGLTVTAQVSTSLLDKSLLIKEFDGGGGLGGDADKRGVLMPWGFGTNYNMEPIFFDTVRNIGMVDGYGNTLSLFWLGEGLNSLGPPTAVYATYAALAAAIDAKQVPSGRWAAAYSAGQPGLIGLGAPPVGRISVHGTFSLNRIGAAMKRVVLNHAQVPVAKVDTTAFDALDLAVPRDVHWWTNAQRNCLDLLQALAADANASPLVTLQGKVSVTRAVLGLAVATLDRSGSIEPRVLNWASTTNPAPYYVLKARSARPATVFAIADVNYRTTLVDRGLYQNDVVYRDGNIVWLKDKSQWLFINLTPAAGFPPPNLTYWQQLQPGATAADISYSDGKTVQQLQPSEAGATNSALPTSPFGSTTVGVAMNKLTSVEQITGPTGSINSRLLSIEDKLSNGGSDTVTVQRVDRLEALARSSTNLLVNGAFGDGANYWTADGAGWNIYPSNRGPFLQNDGYQGAFFRQDIGNITAGQPYSLSAEMDPDAAGAMTLYVDWLTSSGAVISNGLSVQGDNWDRVSAGPENAPSGCTAVRVRVRQNNGSIGRINRIQFELGKATAFKDDGTVSVNAARLTSEVLLRTNQFAASAGRFSNLEAQMAGNTGSGLSARITSVEKAAADANAAVATSVYSLTASVAALSSPNLIANGEFKSNGLNGWSTGGPGSWQVLSFPERTFAQLNGGYFDGGNQSYIYTDVASIQPGKPYCMSFENENDNGAQFHMVVQWLNSNYGYISYSPESSRVSGWSNRNVVGPFNAPSGAYYARVFIFASNNNSGTRRVTKVLFQQGSTPTGYVDTASIQALTATVNVQAGVLVDQGNRVNSLTNSVNSLNTTTAQLVARQQAYWQVTAAAGGARTQVTLLALDNGGVITSEIDMVGNVRIHGNLMVDGSISTQKAADNAFTDGFAAYMDSPSSYNDPNQVVFTYTYTAQFPGKLRIRFKAQQGYNSGLRGYRIELRLNGEIIDFMQDTGAFQTNIVMFGARNVSNGNQTIEVRYAPQDGTLALGNLKIEGENLKK